MDVNLPVVDCFQSLFYPILLIFTIINLSVVAICQLLGYLRRMSVNLAFDHVLEVNLVCSE